MEAELTLKAKDEELWQVTTEYFTCGITTVPYSRVGLIVNQTAPIMAWAKGKTLKAVMKWVESKGGTVRRVGQ